MPKENCGTPLEMYGAIKDVKFLEQLKQNNIDGCYSILITERQAFWDAHQANAGIYQLFNGIGVNIESIDIPQLPNFLHSKGPMLLQNIYQAEWNEYIDINNGNWKYYILDI